MNLNTVDFHLNKEYLYGMNSGILIWIYIFRNYFINLKSHEGVRKDCRDCLGISNTRS
jgi:hypothetical protein